MKTADSNKVRNWFIQYMRPLQYNLRSHLKYHNQYYRRFQDEERA